MFLFLYIPILIMAVAILTNTNKKNSFTGAHSGFMFAMIFYYVVIPFGLLFSRSSFYERDRYGFKDIVKFVFERNPTDYLFALLLTIIGVVCFHFSYRYSMMKYMKKTYPRMRKYVTHEIFNTKLIFIIELFAKLSLGIGLLSLIVHTILVGGLGNALRLAEATRGFDVSLGDFNYIASITKLSSRIITMGSVLYLVLYLEKKIKKDLVLFLISFIASIYYYLLNAGRMPLLTFLIIFIYVILNSFTNKVWPKIILLGALSLPLIDVLSYVFIYFQTGELHTSSFDMANYMRQLSPAYSQLLNIREITDIYGYQYFASAVTDIIDLLPGISFEQSYFATSEYFNGPNWREIGGVPNDVISFGYMQLGVLGVCITLGVWGRIAYYIDKNISKINNKNVQNVLAVAVATQIFQIVHAADIAPILKSNFIFMLVILIFVICEFYSNNELHQIQYVNREDSE